MEWARTLDRVSFSELESLSFPRTWGTCHISCEVASITVYYYNSVCNGLQWSARRYFFNLQNNATLSVRTSGYCTRQRKTFNLVTKETCQLTSIKLYSQCGQKCESCFEHDLSIRLWSKTTITTTTTTYTCQYCKRNSINTFYKIWKKFKQLTLDTQTN